MVYSTSLLKKLNGFRAGFDGAQDYDLVLRAVEQTSMIHHIPKLLYGWRNIPTSTASGSGAKPYAQLAAKKALEDALKRRKISGTPEYISELGYFRINYNLTSKPLVSIIITTRDRPDLLSRLLSSIEKKSTYDNYEIIIVDHLGEKKETKEFLNALKHKVIRYEKEFNISNLFNFAEKYANGQYLLTMNDDLEVISENWIESMLGPCQREEVAIVGAQLIYPDASAQKGQIIGQTIQHAGVVLGVGGIAGHAFRHVPYLHNGYFGLNKTLRNYSAVTGACMLVKRDVYKKVNGYDPILKVAYNDVDFCLRVRKKGYLIVYTPYAKLYHYEGASRGISQPSDNTQTFVNRWKDELLKRDPYYNVNLTLLREDFGFSFSGIPIHETPLALLLEIYATRPDLQKSFPEAATGQYENLINWAITYGISGSKYGLPNDPSSHILSLYKFWYEENSQIKITKLTKE
jgi:GT2 family glycosyltransferase